MDTVMAWAAFLGGWLLVTGPVYQAVLELQSEDLEADRIRALSATVSPPAEVSQWWWLVPPVRFVLVRRRSDRYQHMIIEAMNDEDFAAMTQFVNKTLGWILVAAGGFLLATRETYELIEHQEWPILVFWILEVVMTAVAVGFTVARTEYSQRALADRQARANRAIG